MLKKISLSEIVQEKSLTLSLASWLSVYPIEYWNDVNEYEYISKQMESLLPSYESIQEDDGFFNKTLPKPLHKNDRKDSRSQYRIQDEKNIKIYTDYDTIKNELKDNLADNLQLVDNEDEADFLFLTSNVKNFLSINKLLNQFPFEGGLVRKDLLPLTVRAYCYKNDENGKLIAPTWWLPCFDLSTEFNFLSTEYQRRKKFMMSNKWIIKLSQGTRGKGHVVVNEDDGLLHIAKSAPLVKCFDNNDNSTNVIDRVAQLLVEKPLLINGYKFDLRVFVVVRSFVPFEVYVHNFYYARLANKPYDITQVRDNEIMLTVNCYSEIEDIANRQQRMTKENLKINFETEYDGLKWDDCIESMYTLLHELFYGVKESIGEWPNSRAYYAVDIIFDHSNPIPVPKLVEVNFIGDWHGVLSSVEGDIEKFYQWCNDILKSLTTTDELDSNKFRKL